MDRHDNVVGGLLCHQTSGCPVGVDCSNCPYKNTYMDIVEVVADAVKLLNEYRARIVELEGGMNNENA